MDAKAEELHQVIRYEQLVSIPMALDRDQVVHCIQDNNEFYATDYHTFADFYASEFQLT